MWVSIVLEWYLKPQDQSLTQLRQDLCFAHENVQLLSGNFYARIFSQ